MNDISQFLASHGGPVLFVIVFAEQAGLPLPSAPWLLAAGALSATGQLNPALAIGVTAFAALIADALWFYVGRRGGQRVLRLFCRLSLCRNSCVGGSKDLFARYGLQALVAAKFLPGLGTVMPPLAGALGMKTHRFFLFDGLGALFYGAFYIVAGLVFHNQLQQAIAVLKQLGSSVLLLAAIAAAGYIAFKYARRRRHVGRESHKKAETKRAAVDDLDVVLIQERPAGATFPLVNQNTVQFSNAPLALARSAAVVPEGIALAGARPCRFVESRTTAPLPVVNL